MRGTSKPIGISEYELTRALPTTLQSALPTVEQIEAELAESNKPETGFPKTTKKKSAKRSKNEN